LKPAILSEDGFIKGRDCFDVGDTPTPIHTLTYNPPAYHDELYNHYAILKPTELPMWIPERRTQFLAGRLVAQEALSALTDSVQQIFIGKRRQPIWPTGITGSISHSGYLSIAAIKQTINLRSGLGIDIQSIIDVETQANIASTIITSDENILIKNSADKLSESILFTLVFSAKESFFKALFNTVGEYFNFDVVSVVKIDESQQQMRLKVLKTLGNKLPYRFEVDVSFTVLNSTVSQVITVCSWEL